MTNPTPTQQTETPHEPPSTIGKLFCPKCGQVDGVRSLRTRHYARGRLCDGTPITITYARAAVAGPPGDDEDEIRFALEGMIAAFDRDDYSEASIVATTRECALSVAKQAVGWDATTPSPTPARTTWNAVLAEFADTAIKCHIGFKHEGPWDECEWIKCEDRRKLIESAHAAAPADNDTAQGRRAK